MSHAHPLHAIVPKPGRRVRLADIDPNPPKEAGSEDAAEEVLARDLARIDNLQAKLYAEGKRAVLVVLQGMDTAGKDGTVKHVFRGLNPMGCEVHAFKEPSSEEQHHDFLWRVHSRVPPFGSVGIFNRSHYEEVLVVRVHDLVPKSVWKQRYAQINTFERYLTETGTRVVKFFLHIDREEQRQRLESRLKDPTKNYKYNPGDLGDRAKWDDFQEAYEDALEKCSTDVAPWHIVPANHKWYRNLVIARTLAHVLDDMNPKPPRANFDTAKVKIPK